MDLNRASKPLSNASDASRLLIDGRRGALHKLTDADCRRLGEGNHGDGGGLTLQVKGRSRLWYYKYTRDGHTFYVPLGAYPDRKLKEARAEAQRCRNQLADGIDPKRERERRMAAEQESIRAADEQAQREVWTLEKFARAYHAAHLHEWTPKHGAQWLSSIDNHVFPKLGSRSLAEVTAGELLDVLGPLRAAIPETGTRIRERLDAIYSDALLRGLCENNPAAAIAKALRFKKGERKKRRKHFASLPFDKVPAFVKTLRTSPRLGVAVSLAFEFLILTAARTSEVIGAQWGEINEGERTWTISASRMKGGEAHAIYLSDRALTILREVKKLRYVDPVTGKHKPSDYVFPSPQRASRPLSSMSFLNVLLRLGLWGAKVPQADRITAHGFRSSFSTWANEKHYRPDVIEAALAHGEQNAVRAAYNRAQYFEQRKRLAAEWSAFCEGKATRQRRAVR